MILSVDIWLLPALAAGLSSYLVFRGWLHYSRKASASNHLRTELPVILSFLMGAFCAIYRHAVHARSLENNILVMLLVGGITTLAWLWLSKYLPPLPERFGPKNHD